MAKIRFGGVALGRLLTLLGYDGAAFRNIKTDTLGNIVLAPGGVNLQQFNSVYRFVGSGSGNSGAITIDTAILETNDIVLVTSAFLFLTAGSAAAGSISIYDGVTVYGISREQPLDLTVVVSIANPAVLIEGDMLRFTALTVTAGTVLNVRAVGYYVRT